MRQLERSNQENASLENFVGLPNWPAKERGSMKRLRAGLVGAGLVGQAEHAFYLWEERERFDFVGLADASAAVRNALGARYGIKELHADLPSLLKAGKID